MQRRDVDGAAAGIELASETAPPSVCAPLPEAAATPADQGWAQPRHQFRAVENLAAIDSSKRGGIVGGIQDQQTLRGIDHIQAQHASVSSSPRGRLVTTTIDDGTTFDTFDVPYPSLSLADDEFPMILVTLLDDGQWELHVSGNHEEDPVFWTLEELLAAVRWRQ